MTPAAPVAVCVEVLRVRGSAPREAGARMLVSMDGMQGSIGGGNLEYAALARAAVLLDAWRAEPEHAAELTEIHALGPALGQCCGGAVTLAYRPWFEARLPACAPLFHLQLHGAGHVGRALVAALRALPCTIDWVDQRADAFPSAVDDTGPARIVRRMMAAPEDAVDDAPAGSLFLVMTHDHALDWSICDAILRRRDFCFAGLIGSATKRARFTSRWRAVGIPSSAIARLACPIGIPGIAGKQPEVIALAVAAQLLEVASSAARTAYSSYAADPMSCTGCAALPVCEHS